MSERLEQQDGRLYICARAACVFLWHSLGGVRGVHTLCSPPYAMRCHAIQCSSTGQTVQVTVREAHTPLCRFQSASVLSVRFQLSLCVCLLQKKPFTLVSSWCISLALPQTSKTALSLARLLSLAKDSDGNRECTFSLAKL